MAHVISWLFLLLHTAMATVVQDTDPSIHYDNTWVVFDSQYDSGGTLHATNITGGAASYSFQGEDARRRARFGSRSYLFSTGTAVTFYGLAHHNGAKFSFSISDGPSQTCSCWLNGTSWHFRTELCSITGLGGWAQHTLTITHSDVTGLWVKLDYLK
jgi:hypothetical protein